MSEIENAYQRGKAVGYREAKEKYLDADAYNEGIADAINEVYAIAMNENHDTLIEWLQDHISD